MVIAEPEENRAGELWPKQPLIVTGSRDNTLCVWTLPLPGDPEHKDSDEYNDDASANCSSNPYLHFRVDGHEDSIRSISARGRTAASASYDCTVRIWDIVAGQCLFVLSGHTDKGLLLQLHKLTAMLFGVYIDSSLQCQDRSGS
jgi:F-box and WD-40 domain protein CDC4